MKVVKLNGKLLTTNNKILGANAQEKTVTPTSERQEITADAGYSCLSKVVVEAQSGVPESVFNSLIDRTITSIESSTSSIGSYAFASCLSLIIANIPNATSIGYSAFYNCQKLTSVRFPKVTSILESAFFNCSSCKLFDFRDATQVPTLSNINAFNSTSSTKKIVVPDELYDEWITATNWSSTTNNIVSSIIKASDYEASL